MITLHNMDCMDYKMINENLENVRGNKMNTKGLIEIARQIEQAQEIVKSVYKGFYDEEVDVRIQASEEGALDVTIEDQNTCVYDYHIRSGLNLKREITKLIKKEVDDAIIREHQERSMELKIRLLKERYESDQDSLRSEWRQDVLGKKTYKGFDDWIESKVNGVADEG